jgi:hypothetical protein
MSPLNYSGVYKIEHSGSDMRRITSCAGKEEMHNWPLGRDIYEYRNVYGIHTMITFRDYQIHFNLMSESFFFSF